MSSVKVEESVQRIPASVEARLHSAIPVYFRAASEHGGDLVLIFDAEGIAAIPRFEFLNASNAVAGDDEARAYFANMCKSSAAEYLGAKRAYWLFADLGDDLFCGAVAIEKRGARARA